MIPLSIPLLGAGDATGFVAMLFQIGDFVWRASWQATVLFVLVAFICWVFRGNIAPRWRLLLWALVLARLAVPVTPTAPFSLFNLAMVEPPSVASVESSNPIATPMARPSRVVTPSVDNHDWSEVVQSAIPEPHVDNRSSSAVSIPIATPEQPEEAYSTGLIVVLSLFVAWAIGALVLSIRLAFAVQRLHRLRESSQELVDAPTLKLLSQVCARMGVSRVPKLYVAPHACGPFVTGIRKACIFLPESSVAELSADELRSVLAHEVAHVRRHDVLQQWLIHVVRMVYWFHPAVWVTARQMQYCREEACDDLVLDCMDGTSAQQYGLVLLRFADSTTRLDSAPMLCGILTKRKPLVRRIRRLAHRKEPTLRGTVVALLVTAVVASLGLTDAVPGSLPEALAVQLPSRNNDPLQQDVPVRQDKPVEKDAPFPISQNLEPQVRGNDFQIDGQIMTWDNKIVPHALATLYAGDIFGQKLTKVAQTRTDDQGNYHFEGLPWPSEVRWHSRKYTICIQDKNMPAFVMSTTSTSAKNWRLNLMYPHMGTVSGKVVDERGRPVSGAIVQRNNPVDAEHVGLSVATTDSSGNFRLPRVSAQIKPNGSKDLYLRVRHPDYLETSVTHNDGDELEITLRGGGAIEGTVVNQETGMPLAGVPVGVLAAEPGLNSRRNYAITNASGGYRIVVPTGQYKVTLEDDSRFVAPYQLVECRKGATVKVPPIVAVRGGWIVGKITNSLTGEPVTHMDQEYRQDVPVTVSLFGPSRLRGKLVYQYSLGEVDENGRYRMRALPGKNYPYTTNIRSERSAYTVKDVLPVMVKAGEEVRCDIRYTPELTDEEKVAAARSIVVSLPLTPAERTDAIIAELRKIPGTVSQPEKWCMLLQELVKIGKPAVPRLCRELDSTDQQAMMRRIAFTLRAIDDPRAVPSLVRTLPKTLLPQLNAYNWNVADAELLQFMQQNQIHPTTRGRFYRFGDPTSEVLAALCKLTNREASIDSHLNRMVRRKDPRSLTQQELAIYEAASRWAKWWTANWRRFEVSEPFAKVDLPAYRERETANLPTGRSITKNAETDYHSRETFLSPVGDSGKHASFFLDLDTGIMPAWPERLQRGDSSAKAVATARDWAAKIGVDLLCELQPGTNGRPRFHLSGVGMQLWEIDRFDAKNLKEIVDSGALPEGRALPGDAVLHLNEDGSWTAPMPQSSFLYVTREQGLGVITLTAYDTKKPQADVDPFGPSVAGSNLGIRFCYWTIAR